MTDAAATPRCRHFGLCGGCASQDVAYEAQVAAKAARLAELFGREVEVAASPRAYEYRTRMDYVFAWGKLGLRKKGDPRGVLDLEECPLLRPRAFDAVLRAKEAIRRLGIRPYSYVAHKGYLRYVTVRDAPVRDRLMLVFLTNGPGREIVPLLDEAAGFADSVVWSVTERTADISFGEVKETRGDPWIEERIGDVVLRFGPNSFFQANPWLTERLYAHVAERVRGRAVDLFCGVGGLALFAGAELGVDDSAEAIAFARHNARANGREGVRFEVADARTFLDECRCDTLILDPPRSGLGFKSARRVARAAPARVVYVSCNPKMLAQELDHFRGYAVTDLKAFDLFPQTPHTELVATLDRA